MKKKNTVKPYSGRDHTFAVCAYGESPYLEECVRSLLDQNVKSRILIATSTPNARIIGTCGEIRPDPAYQ